MERLDGSGHTVLTVREVAAYLRVHHSTIYRMLKNNELPAFRVGSDWRFTREAIDEWRLAQINQQAKAAEESAPGREQASQPEGAELRQR